MSIFKMENSAGAPKGKKVYAEEDIMDAVENYVYTWDIGTLIDYAMEGMYDEYMDTTRPRTHIDNLMEKFGKNQ